MPLAEHYSAKAKAFLKTVVCIDDEPGDERPGTSTKHTLRHEDSGFGGEEPSTQADKSGAVEIEVTESHPLNFRETANAFADQGILCSVLEPKSTGDALVERISDLANAADVTILDWELEGRKVGRSSETCRKSIKKILEKDQESGGRLRLIVIFTATDGALACQDLALELVGFDPKPVQDGFALTGNHWRVVVYQKPDTFKPTATPVKYQDLPNVVVEEFSKLTDGLLPSAVLHGITAVRENSHKLLTIFDRDLDGAFLTHRALIPDPDDAEEYLLELLQDELGALIRRRGFKGCVNASLCQRWINSKHICATDESKRKYLLAAVSEPSKKKLKEFGAAFGLKKDMSDRKIADKALEVFYQEDTGLAEKGKERLAVLTSLYGTESRPDIAEIKLQLGVLVFDESDSRYLMCLQPLCDSVRIKETTSFPFLVLDSVTPEGPATSRDLNVRLDSGASVWLQAGPSPKKLVSYAFSAPCSQGPSSIGLEEKNGKKVFTAINGEGYRDLTWIGEVKLGKAQRIASGLAARLHTLGIDEFEWQRLHQSASAG